MRAVSILALACMAWMASGVSADACSIRGRWCGYPNWAANAFEDWTGRAPLPDRPIGVPALPQPRLKAMQPKRPRQ